MPINIDMNTLLIVLVIGIFLILDGRNGFSCTLLLLGAMFILFIITILLAALIVFSPIILIVIVIMLLASAFISLCENRKTK